MLPPLIALLEVTQSAGIVEPSDVSAQPDDAADALDGHHERRGGERDAASAVVGGTVSELGGGKFANGAITNAYSYMYNVMMHVKERINKEKNRALKKQIEEDGILTFYEAYTWYKFGNGEEITVDASKIDLNFIDTSNLEIGKTYKRIQTWIGGISQGIVYGSIDIVYEGNNYISILNDTYDFNILPWSDIKNVLRNIETIGATILHGGGTSFEIHFKGKNYVNH